MNIFFLVAVAETEAEDSVKTPTVWEVFNNFFETSQNLYVFIGILITAFIIMLSIINVRKRARKYTEGQIDSLKKSGKYIPGIFVELNESKEVLRYFVNGNRWKHRLIRAFNSLYENVYGDILKEGTIENNLRFHLQPFAFLDEVETAIDSCLDYHMRLRKRTVQLKPEYKESCVLFEINQYAYSEALEELKNKAEAARRAYFVLTGSAGNGKTNLFCSISELAISLGHAVMLLNARDVAGDITEYLLKGIHVHKILIKHKRLYFRIVDTLLRIRRKRFFVFIDAINENENADFGTRIQKFVNEMEHYHSFKIAVSCRNEYYNEKYAETLSKSINQSHLVYDLKSESYPRAAVERLINCYREYFQFEGYISDAVKHVICEHLLLLRVFFEVNKGKKHDILSIQKHEIFAEYIQQVKERSAPNIEKILDIIADTMLQRMNYDYIDKEVIDAFPQDEIRKAFDETILLNQKQIYLKDTIAMHEKEIVYFVFDEIRDYYLAKRIMIKHTEYGSIDGDAILNKIREIHEAKVSCEEGIVQYTYVFFKTADYDLEEREKYCNQLLDLYRIQDGHKVEFFHKHHRIEFANYGLKILFTNGLSLLDFELDYIRECLIKAPNEDGGKVFDTLLDGAKYGMPNDLNLYFELLFSLRNQEEIIKVCQTIAADSILANFDLPYDLIQIHKDLSERFPDRAVQIQKVAELYLGLFQLHDPNHDHEFRKYFYELPDHKKICDEMKARFYEAIGEEK